MRKCILLYLFIINISINGQVLEENFVPNGNSMPDVLTNIQNISPPSPEAFNFSKYGNVPVGLFTGSPNFNLDLTNFQLGNIKIPISLNYSSNGIHVDQMNGSVGLGWIFINAGVITRTIRDKPDDYSNMNGEDEVPDVINIGINNPQSINYFLKCESDDFDSEPDLYTANFMGNNLKFVFNNSNVPVLLDKSNFKISGSVSGNQFVITGIDGTQYTFSAYERIKNSTSPGMHGGVYVNAQAWYLTSVKNNDDIVNIEYDSSDFTYVLSKLQTMTYTLPSQIQYKYGGYQDHPETCASCGGCSIYGFQMIANVNDQIYTTTQNIFGSKRIKRIYNNRNQNQLTFEYNSQPNDVYKLKNIKKYDNQNKLIDNIDLTYVLTSNNRLYLTNVTNTIKNLAHTFEYYNKEALPARFTYSRDKWGYYNAKNNTTYIPNIDNAMITYSGADQNVNSDAGYYGLLKTIKYPTGGTSILVYENHGSSNQLIGGYRIKTTTDTSEIGITPVTKNYLYYDLVELRKPYYFENRKIFSTCEGSSQPPMYAMYHAITSSNIHQLMSLNPNLFYGKVIEEISGNGKVTHIFETNADYWGNNIKGDPVPTSQWTNFGWNNGKEKSTIFEDADGNKLKTITYNYVEDQSNKTEVRAIARRKLFSPVVYNSTWNNFENLDMIMYKNISRFTYLQSQITTDYLNGNPVVSSTQYFYTNPAHYQLTLKESTTPDGVVLKKLYQYAHEKGNQLMIDKNMVGMPLETNTTQTINGATKTLSKTETIYPTSIPTTQAGNLVLPLSVKSYDIQNNTSSTEVTYDKYDSKGNLQQYTTKDGVSVTIIWGYNNIQPIAKVEGATYDQLVNSGLISAIVSASDLDAANPANEAALITALDSFRNNSALSGYQVSTYTYDPLIGVTSITPPSGIREVYLYDTANRLKEIRESNATGKLLKEFKYNYKN
ncbi:hypothetical protein SAMN05421664_1488 [Chryseobacterium soldanellicola]|uniref:YD repeat-containing protein n=2 Tax=Chryseobacterium soldanellicola TaxID=311333 RepID=A0A1H1AM60_9FLAO|nr:hypothetical protein SAMN05421664_1488 [Chryseobacterium soldanellicola]